jgi:hypothetical protein
MGYNGVLGRAVYFSPAPDFNRICSDHSNAIAALGFNAKKGPAAPSPVISLSVIGSPEPSIPAAR